MQIECPHCHKTLNVPDKYAGHVVKCPACGNGMELPTLEELGLAPSSAPAPAPQKPAAPEPAAKAPPPAPAGGLKVPSDEELAREETEELSQEKKLTSSRRKFGERRSSSRGRRSSRTDSSSAESEGLSDRKAASKAKRTLASYRRKMVLLGLLLMVSVGTCALAGLVGYQVATGKAQPAEQKEASSQTAAKTESEAPVTGAAESSAPATQPVKTVGEPTTKFSGGNPEIRQQVLPLLEQLGIGLMALAGLKLLMSICAMLKAGWVNWLSLPTSLSGAGAFTLFILSFGHTPATIAGAAIEGAIFLLALITIPGKGKIIRAGLDPHYSDGQKPERDSKESRSRSSSTKSSRSRRKR